MKSNLALYIRKVLETIPDSEKIQRILCDLLLNIEDILHISKEESIEINRVILGYDPDELIATSLFQKIIARNVTEFPINWLFSNEWVADLHNKELKSDKSMIEIFAVNTIQNIDKFNIVNTPEYTKFIQAINKIDLGDVEVLLNKEWLPNRNQLGINELGLDNDTISFLKRHFSITNVACRIRSSNTHYFFGVQPKDSEPITIFQNKINRILFGTKTEKGYKSGCIWKYIESILYKTKNSKIWTPYNSDNFEEQVELEWFKHFIENDNSMISWSTAIQQLQSVRVDVVAEDSLSTLTLENSESGYENLAELNEEINHSSNNGELVAYQRPIRYPESNYIDLTFVEVKRLPNERIMYPKSVTNTLTRYPFNDKLGSKPTKKVAKNESLSDQIKRNLDKIGFSFHNGRINPNDNI